MAAISIVNEAGTTFTFDAVGEVTLDASVDVTEHPVEDGSDVSDHAQVKAKRLHFRGVVTESPYDNVDTSGGADRVTRALEFLDGIAGATVTIISSVFGTLENMAITRYPATRGQLRRLLFDLEFKQIRIATAALVVVPVEAPATTSAATGLPDETKVGEQPTQPAGGAAATTDTTTAAQQEAADKSALLALAQALGAAS